MLDNFGFSPALYYFLTIALCLGIFFLVFSIWLYFYSNSAIVPRPSLKIDVYFNNSKKSFIGLFLSVVPVFIMYHFTHWLIYDQKSCSYTDPDT